MSANSTVVCMGCSVSFLKPNSEINRASKRGLSKHYCSNKCQAVYANNGKPNLANLRKKQPDCYSSFRYFLRTTKNRHKVKGFEKTDLTLEYLKKLWEEQEGICPLTGWHLELPKRSVQKVARNTASLDRIEPKQPYSIGNVRFVAHIANMAKYLYTDQDVKDFCRAVVTNTTRE